MKNFSYKNNILSMFDEQVRVRFNQTAVNYEGDLYTYEQLNQAANVVKYKILPGSDEELVAVCMERSAELVAALLGCMKAGCAYLPLDTKWPLSRIKEICDAAKVSKILYHMQTETIIHNLYNLNKIDISNVYDVHDIANSEDNIPQAKQTVYVIYTSGSTGKPKGVINTHEALMNRLNWMQSKYHLCQDDVVLQKTPYSFDVSVWEFFWPLMFGAKIQIAKPGGHIDIQYLSEMINRYSVTVLHFVPSVLDLFMQSIADNYQWPVRQVICSGEALPVKLSREFLKKFQTTYLDNLYGPTEAAIDVSFYRCTGEESSCVPIGLEIDNIKLYVVDKNFHRMEPGGHGELLIAGIGLARGYLFQGGLTADKFMPDPFSSIPGDRVYRTGDLVRLNEISGQFEFLNRIDFQVKINGQRIELSEIEYHLNSHEKINSSVVLVSSAQGRNRLIAYVTTNASILDLNDELCNYLSEVLPQYMVPEHYIILDAMPLNANGKLDRSGLPDFNFDKLSDKVIKPANEIEERLLLVWEALLGISPVSVEESFFRLGGDSIAAAKMVISCKQQSLPLSIKSIYELRTIRKISQMLGLLLKNKNKNHKIAVPAEHLNYYTKKEYDHFYQNSLNAGRPELENICPLPNFVAGMLMESMQLSGLGLNYECVRLEIRNIDLALFRQSWTAVIQHHEILRTSFSFMLAGRPAMLIHRSCEPIWQEFDWSSSSSDNWVIQEKKLIDEYWNKGFSLDALPLMRMVSAKIANSSYIFLWQLHHTLTDGWSYEIVLTQVFQVYHALLNDKNVKLPATANYRDYVQWFFEHTSNRSTQDYWHDYLSGLVKTARISRHPIGDIKNFAFMTDTWTANVTQSLSDLASHYDSTPSVVFQTIWSLLISYLGNESEVVYGLLSSSRPDDIPNIDQAVGPMFVLLPMRVRINKNDSVDNMIKNIQVTQASHSEHMAFDIHFAQQALPKGDKRIYESVIVYENTPLLKQDDNIKSIDYFSRTNQSLVIFIWPGEQIKIQIQYDVDRFDPDMIASILKTLSETVQWMALKPDNASPYTATVLEQCFFALKKWRQPMLDRCNDFASIEEVDLIL